MKAIGKLIGGLAGFAFMLGMCMIDGNPMMAIGTMFISCMVLVGFIAVAYTEEEERLKEKRRNSDV